jgi:hypothetical protein
MHCRAAIFRDVVTMRPSRHDVLGSGVRWRCTCAASLAVLGGALLLLLLLLLLYSHK